MKQKKTMSFLVLAMSFAVCINCLAEEPAVKSGEKIAFLGDSITQAGMGSKSGYCQLVISGLDANGVKATPIGAGISGHKSNQMLERVDKDVISKKPEWMTLSCGVNDVWHGANGVPLDEYQKNIRQIVEKAQAAGIKVMILTSTMIGEDQSNPNNQKLVGYNDFLRALAKEKNCLLADLNTQMQEELKKPEFASRKVGTLLTSDGVHMNPRGDQMMAAGILRAFGLGDEQIQKARAVWQEMPSSVNMNIQIIMSIKDFEQLDAIAAKENKNVRDLLTQQVNKDTIQSLLAPAK